MNGGRPRDELWHRVPLVFKVNGRHVQGERTDSERETAMQGDPTGPFACGPSHHRKLRGGQRCLGCGRSRNEIELDGG